MKRIVLVDDDPAIRKIYKLILEQAGYEVTVCERGEPLLEASVEEPDVYLIDKQLTGIDGLDLCRYVKQKSKKNVPVIIFSASTRVEHLAREAGADEFLEKPFSKNVLLEMLRKLLQEK